MGANIKSPGLPRWLFTRWLVDPGRDIPIEIRAKLVQGLYGSLPIFIGGVVNTLLVSVMIANRLPSHAFLIWVAMEFLLAAVRLPVLIIGRRATARGERGPTDLYLMLGLLWAASVGYGSYISVSSGDWVVAALACLSSAAMVGGICFRNFAAPRLVALMIALSLGPCAVAAVMSGETILLVVAFQIPFYMFSMTVAAYQLNKMLVTTMCAERENDRRARHDMLTRLLNRDGLDGEIARRAEHARRDGATLTLFYLDLDGFKLVNDTRGHAAGDQLLTSVADRLTALAPPGGVVARIGGDEFVLVATGMTRRHALDFGEAIVASIADRPHFIGDEAVEIGVSIGIALLPDHGDTLAALLNAADGALYKAKARGRSRCAIASPIEGSPLKVAS